MAIPPECELDIESLGTVLEAVCDINIKWYNLGLQLGIPVHKLEEIKQQYSQFGDTLREMLHVWLKRQESCTWMALATALKAKSVDGKDIAQQIELDYINAHVENNEGNNTSYVSVFYTLR